jgi:hypothetical protein
MPLPLPTGEERRPSVQRWIFLINKKIKNDSILNLILNLDLILYEFYFYLLFYFQIPTITNRKIAQITPNDQFPVEKY